MKYKILARCGAARAGEITTAHGQLSTPALVAAATQATVKALTLPQLAALGAPALLANTYHLLLRPGTDLIKQAGGLNQFMNYDRPTFTDSGGFQIMSLPGVKINDDGVIFKSHIDGTRLEMTPESSMRAQHDIGADIHMAFDCPIGYGDGDTSRPAAERSMALTHAWAERCLAEHRQLNDQHAAQSQPLQALYGVVQGGEFADLRQQSAEFLAGLDCDGYAVGGMYTADQGEQFLPLINQILPSDKPRHWLGMGAEPRDFFVGVEHGIDTFDCVAPTRQARNGALYTLDGRINILNAKFRDDFGPIDAECDCYTCRHHTRAYLHHLFKAGELTALTLASIHNERFMMRLVEQIRQSIVDRNLTKFRETWLARYYQK
jgi:queuine tRNA-ribosyltransferase